MLFYSTDFKSRRAALAGDPYRPAYHFCSPDDWLNDPNGTVFWRGKYHMFYQHSPHFSGSGLPHAHWGHAVSDDMVHWEDLPIALTPEPGGYDDVGCWSGTSWVDEDKVVACYFAHTHGNAVATSSDDLLINWTKNPKIAVPFDPAKTYDPCIWREGDTYRMISGRITGAKHGHGADQEFGGHDIAYAYKSTDLENWTDEGVFYEGGVFTEPGEDCACPCFFPIGDKHMLLFLAHNRGAQYYLGSYENGRFTPETHGRMNFTNYHLSRLCECGDFTAPIAWGLPNGRRVMVAWLPEGLKYDAQKKAKWAGIMSLPRDLSLAPDGTLRIEPIPELQSLRRNHQSFSDLKLDSGEITLENVSGNCLEIAATIDPGASERVGMKVCCSPDGVEETSIIYNAANGTLTLDPILASENPDFIGREAQIAPLELKAGEPLELRVFIDRSVVEVFANGRQAVCKRIYPSRPDSLGVKVFADGVATVRMVDVWELGGSLVNGCTE